MFLGETPAERKLIYQTVKDAYKIRSKLVHGDVLEKSDKMQKISDGIDKLLRQLFLKILSDEQAEEVFSKSPKDLDEYFNNLAISGN